MLQSCKINTHLSSVIVVEFKGVDDHLQLVIVSPGTEMSLRAWKLRVHQAPVLKRNALYSTDSLLKAFKLHLVSILKTF